jgi:hypothetical protein
LNSGSHWLSLDLNYLDGNTYIGLAALPRCKDAYLLSDVAAYKIFGSLCRVKAVQRHGIFVSREIGSSLQKMLSNKPGARAIFFDSWRTGIDDWPFQHAVVAQLVVA